MLADDDPLVARLFAVDRRFQIDDAVVPLGKARDLHRRAVRHLAFEIEQQLFADQLGADLLFRLVGRHALREERRGLHGELIELLEKLLHAVAGLGGDGDDGVKGIRFAVERDDGKELFRLNGIELVDGKHRRAVCRLDACDQLALLRSERGDRLHNEHDGVHIRDALAHDIHHIVAKAGARLMEAGGIKKYELRLPALAHGGDAVSRRLRFVGYDGDLLSGESVRQGGLADVGPSANGDHGSFRNHSRAPS